MPAPDRDGPSRRTSARRVSVRGTPSRHAPRVAGHPLPALLASSDDPDVAAWRDGLPALVDGLLDRWGLTAGAPFEPGGSSAWVAPVREADGAQRVLKVAWAHDEARDEAAGMAAWQGRGAARVHRQEQQGQTSALLLERVWPGRPLAELLDWPRRDEIVAAVAQQLWVPPAELVEAPAERVGAEEVGTERVGTERVGRFRPLAQMCARWADSAQQRADMGDSPLPAELVTYGLELFRELPRQWDGEAVLLATDLHPGNVLVAEGDGTAADGAHESPDGRRWVLIDPKPYVGDPHYDLLQHMFNDPDRLRGQPVAFVERMAGLAGLDPWRLRQWLFARCVQESGVLAAASEAAQLLADAGVD